MKINYNDILYKKMKKIVYILLLISSLTYAQIEKQVGEFSKVTSFDKIDVYLIKSNENKVVLKGNQSNDVEIVNKNGELKIRMPITKLLQGDAISATVYYTNIEAVEANEGSRIASKEEIKAINFDVIAKEGSEVKLVNLQTSRLKVRTSGGSVVTVIGSSKNQEIIVNSGAKFDGQDCISSQTIVTVNAGGIANIHATDFVDAKTRAGGDILIFGKPKQINQKTIAGGTIKQAN